MLLLDPFTFQNVLQRFGCETFERGPQQRDQLRLTERLDLDGVVRLAVAAVGLADRDDAPRGGQLAGHRQPVPAKLDPQLMLEHRIPQRAVRYLAKAGIDRSIARRLAHYGDPANLYVVHRELHAVFDSFAKFGRNPSLEAPFDDRRERPFGAMTPEQLAAVIRETSKLDLNATTARQNPRDVLRAEQDRRKPKP